MGYSAASSVGGSIGGYSAEAFSTSVGGKTKNDIQNTINRLTRIKEQYEGEGTLSSSKEKELAAINERIEKLRERMNRINERNEECQTCKNREYQDRSDDPGVSFKSAAKINPSSAASVVRGHEYEHVTRDRAEAERNGREVVSQNVVIKHGLCPECGKSYVAGGVTTTVTRPKSENRYTAGIETQAKSGERLNTTA